MPRRDGAPVETDPRARSGACSPRTTTCSAARRRALWLDHVFAERVRHRRAADAPRPPTATYDRIGECLARRRVPAARAVRALQHRGARHHRSRRSTTLDASPGDPRQRLAGPGGHRLSPRSGRRSRSTTASADNAASGSASSPARTPRPGSGYLAAHRKRRAFFNAMGATSTDHGHPTARTADLSARARPRRCSTASSPATADAGRRRAVPRPDADRDGADEPGRRAGDADPSGLVRATTTAGCPPRFGRDKGADIPTRTDYVARAEAAARPLRQRAAT